MKIVNFSNYIKESQIRTLDMVIDKEGNLYRDPIKGNIDIDNESIIGVDGKYYIAGIERTGKLFSFLPEDKKGNILLNNQKVIIPRELSTDRIYWNKKENYSELLSILPTGLVNIKIDMEVIKKTRRFSRNFSNRIGVEGLKDRLSVLSKNIKLRSRSTKTIQRELSAIMMLHHLNELKNHFDPSSAGFLFESYIAGLIPGSSVKEDNSSIDLEDKKGNTYQIKLLDSIKGVPIRRDKVVTEKIGKKRVIVDPGVYLSYYIVCFKHADKVRIFILDGVNNRLPQYIENFKAENTKTPQTPLATLVKLILESIIQKTAILYLTYH